jgi:hypothetical protein
VNIVTFVRHDERVDSAIFSHEKYVKRLENLFVGFNIANDSQKRALLLHYSGEEASEFFDTLPDTGSSYDSAKKALNEHFNPSKNTEFERYTFRQSKQQPS